MTTSDDPKSTPVVKPPAWAGSSKPAAKAAASLSFGLHELRTHLESAGRLLDEAEMLVDSGELQEPPARPLKSFWRAVAWQARSGVIDERSVAYASEEDLERYNELVGSLSGGVEQTHGTAWTVYVPRLGDTLTVLTPIVGADGTETGAWIGRIRPRMPLTTVTAGRVFWIARTEGTAPVLVLALSRDAVFAALDRQGRAPGETTLASTALFWHAERVEDDAEVHGKFDKVLLDDGREVPLSTVIEARVRP